MRDIGDARIQIEELLSGAPDEASVRTTPRMRAHAGSACCRGRQQACSLSD